MNPTYSPFVCCAIFLFVMIYFRDRPTKKEAEEKAIEVKKQRKEFFGTIKVIGILSIPFVLIAGFIWATWWLFTTPMAVSLPTTIGGWLLLFWAITPSRQTRD